jgi:gas vesicle protein
MGLFSRLVDFFKRFGPRQTVENGTPNEADIFGTGEIIYTVEVVDVRSIISICHKDFSRPGYAAAQQVPDMGYARQVLDAIKGKLLNYVKTVELKYKEKLNEKKDKHEFYTKENLNDLANTVAKEIEVLKEEMEQLNHIKNQIEDETENGAFMHVKETFLTGFKQGVVEHHKINGIRANL